MNLTYEKCGDYLIPNLIPDPERGGVEKVRADAEILFRESQEGYLFRIVVIGKIERASAFDTGAGGGDRVI